jgi:hypothetical protein
MLFMYNKQEPLSEVFIMERREMCNGREKYYRYV